MKKTEVPSPFPEEFPGYISVPDALTFPQLLMFEAALVSTRGKADALSCVNSIGAVNSIVEWHIDNLPDMPKPEDIFEGHPYGVAGQFYRFVMGEVARVFRAEKDVPKVSGSPRSNTPKTPTEPKTKTEAQTPSPTN